MRCHACQTEMRAGDRFCSGCGAPARTSLICTDCGTENQATNAFCVGCGHRLMPVAIAPGGPGRTPRDTERKFVTVLRSDLVGSTPLVAGLDAEDAMTLIEPAMVAMRAAVRQYGGIVTKELGDGVQAVFCLLYTSPSPRD